MADKTLPVDFNTIFPELNGYLIRPLLVSPPLCALRELQDGTYTLYDIEVMHQIIEIKQYQSRLEPPTQIAQH